MDPKRWLEILVSPPFSQTPELTYHPPPLGMTSTQSPCCLWQALPTSPCPGPALSTALNLRSPPLTASRCPRATEKPMARGAEPPRSRRLRSVVASTHSTSCRVPMISMPRPWPEFTPGASCREEGQQGLVSRADGNCVLQNSQAQVLGQTLITFTVHHSTPNSTPDAEYTAISRCPLPHQLVML
jgi:hypothetical protein